MNGNRFSFSVKTISKKAWWLMNMGAYADRNYFDNKEAKFEGDREVEVRDNFYSRIPVRCLSHWVIALECKKIFFLLKRQKAIGLLA